jgi:serine/threonine protein kinase
MLSGHRGCRAVENVCRERARGGHPGSPGRLSTCPRENTLLELVEGRLDREAERQVVAHIEACTSCQDVAGEVVCGAEPPAASAPVAPLLGPGAVVGRYVVLGVVGAGAMGVVYAAHDPELQRKVALKLVRPDVARSAGRAAARRERLLREARALARLSHPHVVAVHDAGTWGDQVFLAMEHVEGETLGAWLRRGGRTAREILDVFVAAGEGLAAAHAAGLVHRDFKPENVLVSHDGRVKVADFGLARGEEERGSRELCEEAIVPCAHAIVRCEQDTAGGSGAAITRPGALVGTPAYMAPEQLAGGPADARSDQFAFCVALHEALFGERPFPPGAAAPGEDAAKAPVRSGGVPRRVRLAIERGLRARPDERWEGMRPLLSALADGPLLPATVVGSCARVRDREIRPQEGR